VREAARKDGTLRFTALMHHITPELLVDSFYELKRDAAPGVDGVTWQEYEQDMESRVRDLHQRVHRGTYRASPSRRHWISKPDGRQRPLGIATLEDKIVQQAVLKVLQQIYEADFLGFSYGFRPGRSCHQALDALWVALMHQPVNWVLDADIEGFFDAIDHTWLIKFLEHRIGDRRILRLIRQWLQAGVSEDGKWSGSTVGSPQGSVISPLLANVYLHYVLDLWLHWWRTHHCKGQVIIVRYADDFVIGFEHRHEADACLEALRARFTKFGLTLHDGKTRLIEYGRRAYWRHVNHGTARPESFDFLGFTHYCGVTLKNRRFFIWRRSIGKRLQRKLAELKAELRKRMHWPVGEVGRWLASVLKGWYGYHAVPGNSRRLYQFLDELTKHWLHVLRRRSQRGRARWTWARMHRLSRRYLPQPRILHPYPADRFRARFEAGAV
jgi:group II intron reverse transcriptase/maturase